MGITVEKEVNIAKKLELCVFKIKREKGGVTVYIKSKMLEDYFKDMANGAKAGSSALWNEGKEVYKSNSFSVAIPPNCSRQPYLFGWNQQYLFSDDVGMNNFTFIRGVGISEGVSYTFPGLFLAKELEKFKDEFKIFIIHFYQNFLKTCEFEIVMTTTD